jgi:integrase
MTGNAVRQAFEHLRARAGLSDFHFHDFRHEAISRFFERELSLVEVGAITGHRDLKSLQRYVHLRAKDLVARFDSLPLTQGLIHA